MKRPVPVMAARHYIEIIETEALTTCTEYVFKFSILAVRTLQPVLQRILLGLPADFNLAFQGPPAGQRGRGHFDVDTFEQQHWAAFPWTAYSLRVDGKAHAGHGLQQLVGKQRDRVGWTGCTVRQRNHRDFLP